MDESVYLKNLFQNESTHKKSVSLQRIIQEMKVEKQ